ncbi:MAG: replicative DNA helicase [Oscillospiraceae bacterium]|nr:replicative DNA helicase [Oscillospiraceae bacterium]
MDEELIGMQAPQSVEAEQAVLGAILIDSSCLTDIIGILQPKDFYLKQNREIYEAIYTMFNFSQSIDPVTVLEKMRELGFYREDDKEDSRSYLRQLMEITPTTANAVRYANIVRDKAVLRGLADAAKEIADDVYEQKGTPAEILEGAEKKIYSLRKGEHGDSLEHIGTTVVRVFDHLTELAQSDSKFPGLSTGLRDLDAKINGLNKSDLVLLAARPAMGKTAFALNLCLNVAKKYNKTVAMFSLEMSREQLAMRLLSIESFIDGQKLQTGKLTDEEWTKLIMACGSLSQTDIRVDDNASITVGEMSAKCRRLDNLGLVIVDYLQLMSKTDSGRNNDSRVNIVSEISRSLKIMAKDLNVPVLCLSQLSRGPEGRPDKRPMLSDLRESGSIEQDADEVLFLYRDEYYNPNNEENKGIAECIVQKNRHGEIGTVNLQWIPQYQTFTDLEWKHAE